MLAQLLSETEVDQAFIDSVAKIADQAAQKDFKWWFAALFTIMLMACMYVFKHLQQQLSDERKEHDLCVKELMRYLQEDHVKAITVIDRLMPILDKISAKMHVQKNQEDSR